MHCAGTGWRRRPESTMQTLELLGKRIRTVEGMRSVVRTMKSLSQVSIHQYEVAASAIGEYHRTVSLGLQIVLRTRPPPADVEQTGVERVAVLLFGSDHGLCGRFNDEVVDFALRRLAESGIRPASCRWLVMGARAAARLEARDMVVTTSHGLPGSVGGLADAVGQILVELDRWREAGHLDRCLVFSNRREPMAAPAPREKRLWPPDQRYLRALSRRPWESRALPIHTMDAEALFSALIRQHLFVTIFQAGADSLAAEHAARLAAMQAAERNIAEQLQEMQAEFRRERQNAITAELLDIIAGYEATRPPDAA